ncbi:MAG: sec-independent protein translocase protein TatA [Myxococcota bacterium]|jgi:sec-independent protein translocase protein TatA
MNALLIGGLGPGELVLILVIVLIIFGAGKLPQIGDALGKGIRNFKQASTGEEDLEVEAKASEAAKTLPPAVAQEPVLDAEEVAVKKDA